MNPPISPHGPGGTRALIIADSLALPRGDVDYAQTWPAMLAARMTDIAWINRAQRLATTERLNHEGNGGADCLEFYRPNLVILQLGICDCAPRVLHRRTAAFVHRLPFGLGRRVPAWLERRRGRKVDNCFVPEHAYEANLRSYLTRAAGQATRVIAIAIMPASPRFAAKNPRAVEQIARYNAVLGRLSAEFDDFRVLNPFADASALEDMFVDGYHLNERGAREVADRLEPLVQAALAAPRAGT